MFDKKKKPQRFQVKEEWNQDFGSGSIQIVADTLTGVNYIVTVGASIISGITPLLDENGNVVIDKRS